MYRVNARALCSVVLVSVAVASLCIASLAGCGGKGSKGPLFEVAGKAVTAEDVLAAMPTNQQVQLYNQVLGRILIEAEAKKQGITVDESLVDLMISRMESMSGGAAALDERLAGQGSSRESLRDDARLQVLTYALATQNVQITDEEVREFYDKNAEAFGTPASYKYEMFQDTDRGMVDKLVSRVKAGEPFLVVAEELRPGMTRASEDEIRFMSASEIAQIDPMGLSVLESLQVGQLSDVQSMPFGTGETVYRVYYLFDRTEADIPPFEQVEPLVRMFAKMSKPEALDPSQLVASYVLEYEVEVLRDDLGLALFEQQLAEYKSRQTQQPAEGDIPLPPEGAGGVGPVPSESEAPAAAASQGAEAPSGGTGTGQ